MHQVDVITSKRIADDMHFALHHTPDVTDEVRHRGTRARDIHPTVARAMRHIRGLRLPRLGLHSVVLRMLWLRLNKPGENCARQAHTTTFGALFVLALELSCYVGEVRVTPLVEGLPGFFNYLRATTLDIHRSTRMPLTSSDGTYSCLHHLLKRPGSVQDAVMCDNASLLQWQPSAVFYLNPAIAMSGTDPLAFSRAYVVWLPQSWLGWHAPMAAAGLVGQSLQTSL